MKINFDRICRLAGVESKKERRARLTEGASHSYKMEMEEEETHEGVHSHMEEYDEADYHMEEYDEVDDLGEYDSYEAREGAYHMEEDEMDRLDEVVEVDPRVLMEEIRRAKKLKVLKENRKRSRARKQQQLQENHLKRVIRKEIQNIMSEIDDIDGSWVYGEKKPKHSKKGYTNHGRTLPGIGFNKKW
mgnify:CR=1 FL=1